MDAGRIVKDIRVAIAKPRAPGTRYSAEFSRHCAQVREAMDRVPEIDKVAA
jgi:hypothetical protein